MKKQKPVANDNLQEKVNSLLEQKIEEISRQTGEYLSGKEIDVLIKLANLRDKLGGRPLLAASVAIVDELLGYLEEADWELKGRLEEHLEGFFAKMRADYE